MSSMKSLLESMYKFAGQEVGQKPGDQVRGTEKAKSSKSGHPFKGRLVGASESANSLLKELESELQKPEAEVKRDLVREFAAFKEETTNVLDVIKVDVPLLIRLLEYAREDAKTDMDLHDVAEQLISLSATGKTLSMNDYDAIVGEKQIDEYGGYGGYGAASQAPQGTTKDLDSPATKQAKLDQAQIQKSTQNLASTLNAQGAAQPVNKVKFQDVLTKLDNVPNTDLSNQEQNQLGPLAVAASKIMQNPQTAGQLKSLITKADQIDRAKQQQVKQAEKQVGTNEPAAQQQQNKTQAGQTK